MQIKLLHDRRDAFGADPDAAFGQSDANFSAPNRWALSSKTCCSGAYLKYDALVLK